MLVAPVQRVAPQEERIIEFKGLNKRSVIEDGEMRDMWNLTADNYPLLTPRKPRGVVDLPSDVMRPLHIVKRYDKIGVVAISKTDGNVYFYYDGVKRTQVTGLTTETKAVAINTKMCFFPQKTYLEIAQTNNGISVGGYHSLDATVTLAADTSVTITSEDTRITLPAGHGFSYDDAVNIVGTISYVPDGGSTTTAAINASCVIEQVVNTNTLVLPQNTFIELIGEGATTVKLVSGTTISRTMPDVDHVIEWNNRLWGASNTDNTIYACKLGDPTNWHYFQGVNLDSFYAQQGTDELFTGVGEYSGHLIFFKPNSMCRVYGTAPTNYQITNTACYGCEDGSGQSVLTINDTVFYKSAIGIMAYQGGTPTCISDKFDFKFKNVVAGTEGHKYYASCLVDEGENVHGRLLVFDLDKGLWHVEDDLRFRNCCKIGEKVYYTTASADVLVCDVDVICARDLMVSTDLIEGTAGIINPDTPGESYDDMEWMAQFGPFDEYIEEHKIYSKLALRLIARGTASAKVYISLNEGEWEQVADIPEISTKGDFIPIVPRRCDRYSIKVEGKGNCAMKSLTRRVRPGSFGRI